MRSGRAGGRRGQRRRAVTKGKGGRAGCPRDSRTPMSGRSPARGKALLSHLGEKPTSGQPHRPAGSVRALQLGAERTDAPQAAASPPSSSGCRLTEVLADPPCDSPRPSRHRPPLRQRWANKGPSGRRGAAPPVPRRWDASASTQ